jgi:ribosomal protein S12 methylthiotransferase
VKTKNDISKKINLITMGCSKNIVDSENLRTQLVSNEFEVEHDSDGPARKVIINTCGFIDKAKEESVNAILEYAEKKKKGEIDEVVVMGCLSERYRDDLEKEIPEVDAYFGTQEMDRILHHFNAEYKHDLIGERQTSTPAHYAYLKISEGCNRTCSFCAIPLMRGKHRSRSIEDLVQEARNLASNGVKELMLIAQELTYYGLDLYKERRLPDLLKALAGVEGIEWIRLHYAYPSKFPIDIIHVMAETPEVCNYLDIPLQHANNHVLKRMRRQITREETVDLINRIREIVPEIAIRTTVMVGFPGETEEEFEDLLDFVREMQFERLGAFTYSHEEDTSAHDLEDDVPEDVKIDRYNRLMEVQREISFEKNLDKIGQRYRVLIDRVEGDYFVGRSEYDSPEVDNEVLISTSHYCRVGDFREVEVTNAEEYDLFARPVVD